MADESNIPTVKEICLGDLFADRGRRYEVPLYQREYAWGNLEISKMLTDLWASFNAAPGRNYYLGTLVVCPREGILEVVDGQQRLTTLSLLMGVLRPALQKAGLMNVPIVSFASREKVNEFLIRYCHGLTDDEIAQYGKQKEIEPFVNAIGFMQGFRPSEENGDLMNKSLLELFSQGQNMPRSVAQPQSSCMSFGQYVLEKVVLFEVSMPPKTDTMAYFEVMNNRGEQLEYHELLKARLLDALYQTCCNKHASEAVYDKYAELSGRFDRFWTACSRMDGHLIDHLHACQQIRDGKKWTDPCLEMDLDVEINETNAHERQSVIRDFSNFLMHVLRLYEARYGLRHDQKQRVDISLDERKLKEVVDDHSLEICPIKFLGLLLWARLEFDSFVVKVKMADNAVEEWRLKDVRKENKHYQAFDTFANRSAERKLIKIESALQVSNDSQRYKEWVYKILSVADDVRHDAGSLLEMLEEFAASRIVAPYPQKNISEVPDAVSRLGLNTPRILLNVIDYLMWKELESANAKKMQECEFLVPSDFEFSYLNSVEHHHAQSNSADIPWVPSDVIQDIGNLYLTSTSENSSMGKLPAFGKVEQFKCAHNSLPSTPKRYWMYKRTEDKRGWSWEEDAKLLSDYVKGLLRNFLDSCVNRECHYIPPKQESLLG